MYIPAQTGSLSPDTEQATGFLDPKICKKLASYKDETADRIPLENSIIAFTLANQQ